jgi:hypothetical protein
MMLMEQVLMVCDAWTCRAQGQGRREGQLLSDISLYSSSDIDKTVVSKSGLACRQYEADKNAYRVFARRYLLYRVGHEKVARLPFARVLVIFSLALVYCVE